MEKIFKLDVDMTDTVNILFIILVFFIPLSSEYIYNLVLLIIFFAVLDKNLRYYFSLMTKNKLLLTFAAIFVVLFVLAKLSYDNLHFFIVDKEIFYINYEQFLLKYLGMGFIFFAIFITYIKEKYIKYILWSFILSMIISEISSYLLFFNILTPNELYIKIWLLGLDIPVWSRGGDPSPFLNHSYYSMFLAVTILLLVDNLNPKKRVLFLFEILFIISATINLFINGGRLGQLGFLIGSILYLWFKFKNKRKYFLLGLFMIIAVFNIAYFSKALFHNRVNQSINSLKKVFYQNNYWSSWGRRIAADKGSIIVLTSSSKYFLLGLGAGNSQRKYHEILKQKNKSLDKVVSTLAHLHNQFFTFWVEGGIVPIILILLYFYFLYKYAPYPITLAFITIMIVGFNGEVVLYHISTLYLFILMSVILYHYKKLKE